MKTTLRLATILILMAALCLTGCTKQEDSPAEGNQAKADSAQRELVIFSWWTAGGEAEGLKDIINLFKKKNPDVKVTNAAVAGGAGTNAKAVLKTRMLGGDPPDSFQVHGGAELLDTWVKAKLMEPIDSLYNQEGWLEVYPKDLVDMVRKDGKIYAVPSNVHRGNALWYNKALLAEHGIEPPLTFEAFFAACDKLQAAGVTPISLASRNKWPVTHLFETVLLGVGGPAFYRELFAGKIAWSDDRVRRSLDILARIMGYVNRDHAALTWDQACGLLMKKKAAMNIMGDWAKGYFTTNGWKPDVDFGTVPAPGNEGNFIVVTDTFGLPTGAAHREVTLEFLRVLGSEEGQVAFNIRKGSIPARTGVPVDQFDSIMRRTIDDFAKDTLVPSLAHGSAATELFVTAINDELGVFIQYKDTDKAIKALEAAAQDAGL